MRRASKSPSRDVFVDGVSGCSDAALLGPFAQSAQTVRHALVVVQDFTTLAHLIDGAQGARAGAAGLLVRHPARIFYGR